MNCHETANFIGFLDISIGSWEFLEGLDEKLEESIGQNGPPRYEFWARPLQLIRFGHTTAGLIARWGWEYLNFGEQCG